jgi:hypothetical protein
MALYPVSLYHRPLEQNAAARFQILRQPKLESGTLSAFCYLTRYVAVIADCAAVKNLG